MKIIHFLNELKFSGAEIMYVDAATEFKKLGGGTLAAVNTAEPLGEYAPYFEQAGYKVYHLPYPKSIIQRWKYYNKVVSILKREHYDVVHIHSSGLKWGMSYCAWRAGCKSVYTFHNVFRSHWYSFRTTDGFVGRQNIFSDVYSILSAIRYTTTKRNITIITP